MKPESIYIISLYFGVLFGVLGFIGSLSDRPNLYALASAINCCAAIIMFYKMR